MVYFILNNSLSIIIIHFRKHYIKCACGVQTFPLKRDFIMYMIFHFTVKQMQVEILTKWKLLTLLFNIVDMLPW